MTGVRVVHTPDLVDTFEPVALEIEREPHMSNCPFDTQTMAKEHPRRTRSVKSGEKALASTALSAIASLKS